MATPGISARYSVKIARLKRSSSPHPDGYWQVFDADDQVLAEAELLVLAAGFESAGLAETHAHFPLQAIRGQVAWGDISDARTLPPFPVNGHGSFIPSFLNEAGQLSWLMGASFERDNSQADVKVTDKLDIFGRLQQLLPPTAEALKATFDEDLTRAWVGVRCASPDHFPLVGPLDEAALPGLCVCTALGSRGLSFAVLCGELLAAGLHAEPLPVEKRLVQSMLASRCRATE